MRTRMPREFYIPKGSTKITDKASTAVAYIYERNSVPYAAAFHGKADKPDWHFRFKDTTARAKRIADHFKAQQDRAEYMAKRKSERNAKGHGLELGDVLKSSWGYDQTNIDYYEVTAIIGKRMVEIRPIAQQSIDGQHYMTGKCVPIPGQYTGKPMRKAAHDGGVKIASYAWARKIEPKIIGGLKIYDAASWTSYA